MLKAKYRLTCPKCDNGRMLIEIDENMEYRILCAECCKTIASHVVMTGSRAEDND